MADEKPNTIKDILESYLVGLKIENEGLHTLILDKAEQGFFEAHHSAGNIKSFANDILTAALKIEK